MQVEHDPGARLARGLERAVAEQRVDVVEVGDGRAELAHGARDLVRVVAAAQHGARGVGRARSPPSGARARRAGCRRARARPSCSVDRALLAARVAVGVVDDEDARTRHRGTTPSAGRTSSRDGRPQRVGAVGRDQLERPLRVARAARVVPAEPGRDRLRESVGVDRPGHELRRQLAQQRQRLVGAVARARTRPGCRPRAPRTGRSRSPPSGSRSRTRASGRRLRATPRGRPSRPTRRPPAPGTPQRSSQRSAFARSVPPTTSRPPGGRAPAQAAQISSSPRLRG